MKRLIVTILVVLGMCGIADAQTTFNCPGGGQETFNYSLNTSGTTLTPPNQMTTVAATVSAGAASVSGTPGAIANLAPQSHNLTVTAGTYIYYQWQSYNAVSATSWATDNGTIISGWNYLTGLSGTLNTGMMVASEVGHTYVVYYQATAANASKTRDHLTIKVVAGSGPSVISSDNLYTNVYFTYVAATSGGLTSSPCSGDSNHRAIYEVQLVNTTSGETRYGASVTTAQVCPYCTVPSSAVDSISMLPGDSVTVTGSITIQMNCEYQMSFSNLGSFGLPKVELVWTQVQDLGLPALPDPTDPTKNYYTVAIDCSPQTTPPDWSPRQVRSPVRPSFELGMSLCERWPNIEGLPWVCPASFAEDFHGGKILNWVTVSVPWLGGLYDCTNYDKGYSGYPLNVKWPFPF